MDFQGAENVPIVGKGKKQQISGTFSGTKSGLFLPTRASARPSARPRVRPIYKGKTSRPLPKGIDFPDGFDITQTENHWSNEDKCIQHIETIIVPYLKAKREEMGLSPD